MIAATLITACSKETRKARLLGEADGYFKAGNYDKAKVTYLNVIQLDPQNALAFERIGAIWQDDAAPLRAAAFLKKASELDPKNIENRIRLARCYFAIGRPADAKNEALAVLKQAPDDGDAIVVLSEAARTKEDIQAAGEELQKFPRKNDVAFHLATAKLFFSRGNTIGAANELQQALAADPKSAAAHMGLGDLHLIRKEVKQAAEEYKKAADLAPLRSTERLKYAAFMSVTGGAEETRRVATEMTREAPDYLPGWVLLAELASKDKNYDKALSLLENVFGRDPEYVDGRRLQSDVLMEKGDTKKAVQVMEHLDKTYSGEPLIKYQLARAYLRNNNPNQAKLALQQAVSANGNYLDAVLLLGEINIRAGHSESAIEPLRRVLKTDPEQRRAALLLATAYGTLDRPDDAAAVLQEQARLAPKDPQPYAALGLTYRRAKKYDQARQEFEKAAQLDPGNADLVSQLIEIDLAQKRFDSAQQRIQNQFHGKLDSADAHFWQARVFAAEGKWDGVEDELRRTLKLDPNFSGAYDLLVQGYIATNKLPQAINELEQVLAKDPKNPSALMTLALVYDRTKEYPKERDAYEKALAINPSSVLALNNLAYLYAERLGDLDKAYDFARKARDLKSDDAAVADTLGWVLYKRGDYQQAVSILQESAEKNPDSPDIQFHLGMTAYMMGETDLARVALRKAAGSTTDFEGREESKRWLASLENGKGASPELSLTQLETMTSEHPDDVVSQIRLGYAYQKQGAFEKAAAAFERAVKLNPQLGVPTTKLAELYAGPLHNKQKALAYAQKARGLAPDDPQIPVILGKIAFENANFTWSYSLLQEAARQNRGNPAVLHDLAWSAYALGKVNEARDLMQKVVAAGANTTESGDAEKFLMFTALDQDSKQLLAAENEVQQEIASNHAYVPALMAQAALYAQHGQSIQAIEMYNKILHTFPDLAPAQKHLAMLYAQNQSTINAAYDTAIKARKALPDDPELAELLGRLSYEKKEYLRAVQLLQESARQKTLDANSLFYLGMSQLQAKQKSEARGVLNEALTNGLQEPFATEAKRALADQGRQ
jgi:tetratricopeptide (TPR) repeat protein